MKNKYQESVAMWIAWREKLKEEHGHDPIQSLCLWEFERKGDYGAFKLECWNVKDHGPVVFQFWPDGGGFTTYASGLQFPAPKSQYFLLGEKACEMYFDEPFDQLLEFLKNNEGYATLEYDPNETDLNTFLCQFDGWMGFAEVTEEQYNQIIRL